MTSAPFRIALDADDPSSPVVLVSVRFSRALRRLAVLRVHFPRAVLTTRPATSTISRLPDA